MDPIALIAEIIDSRQITTEQCMYYNGWLSNGGFPAIVGILGGGRGAVMGVSHDRLRVRTDDGDLVWLYPSELKAIAQ